MAHLKKQLLQQTTDSVHLLTHLPPNWMSGLGTLKRKFWISDHQIITDLTHLPHVTFSVIRLGCFFKKALVLNSSLNWAKILATFGDFKKHHSLEKKLPWILFGQLYIPTSGHTAYFCQSAVIMIWNYSFHSLLCHNDIFL